jgi:uncharacterized protein (TIGR01777 family)
MKILLSGSSGFIGLATRNYLEKKGHLIFSLKRGFPCKQEKVVCFDPEKKEFDPMSFERFDAFIHLSGEPLFSLRWTKSKKEKIKRSRVDSSSFLAQIFNSCKTPPKTIISASAIGFYGDRKETILPESSPRGDGFLAEVCQSWENAFSLLETKCRIVHPRFAIVLGSGGGVLKNLIPLYRCYLGTIIGKGDEFLSWIAIEDLVRGLDFLLNQQDLKGPVNFSSPFPVTHEKFSKTLAQVLHTPLFFRLPPLLVQLLFGEMGKELLLASQRTSPEKLLKRGFQWTYPHLEGVLESIFHN